MSNFRNKTTYCFRNCGTRIKFDQYHKSQSGKMIPIDADTGEDHQCPNSTFAKAQRGELQEPKQQQAQQQQQTTTLQKGHIEGSEIEILEERVKELEPLATRYIEYLEAKIKELEPLANKYVEQTSFQVANSPSLSSPYKEGQAVANAEIQHSTAENTKIEAAE